MPTKITGDFTKYPESLQDILPYLEGETCELRGLIEIYRHLFMKSEERILAMGERLGGVLGYLQQFIQDEMFVGISRLTDRDSRQQSNLSLWGLVDRCTTCDPEFGVRLKLAVERISTAAYNVRAHRNKRIAHYDIHVSLGATVLPQVTFTELFSVIGQIEGVINDVSRKFIGTTMMFEMLDHREITTSAEITVLKAIAYDAAVKAGKLDRLDWRAHIFGQDK